ncbi:MAG: lytic transglycosylase domain-containing protein [Phaeodactylibacter sp.]|nr:lytic transglycosylase domain-containing protein [Phaeodactylibacter sp.]MCB9304362.1 lytic transglycosylase domain-containing protein [Lewinellaceae bacterium]HQU59029.1 lytic transglycosylase domain-containing protein [Saprospiraceae bacterium]
MRTIWTTTTFALLTIGLQATSLSSTPDGMNRTDWDQELSFNIPVRLLQMEFPFEVEYNPEVQNQLDGYLRRGRRETERMLGRTALYFPIFEYYLHANGLPEALKYIPLLESRLRPEAESGVGAVGLWQFMPATAEHYHLQANDYLDERMNPFRSTEAAVKMLSQLFDDFGDWSLALAAYNCGAGRVRRALRRTGCDNFWDIQHLLPLQTQRYLPALIATIYTGRDYARYGLEPASHGRFQKPFRVFKIHSTLHLADIARHCQLSPTELYRLNPGYLQEDIPFTGRAHYLILPEKAFASFQQYIIKESRKGGPRYAIAVLDSRSSRPSGLGSPPPPPKENS